MVTVNIPGWSAQVKSMCGETQLILALQVLEIRNEPPLNVYIFQSNKKKV